MNPITNPSPVSLICAEFCTILLLFLRHFSLLVTAMIPQSEHVLQTFGPNGRQLIVHVKAKL